MAQARRKVMFDEYKTIKDEIIAISEQRFENILTKRLEEFRKSIISEMRWLIGLLFIIIASLMTIYKFIK
jgi:hypothetical protein